MGFTAKKGSEKGSQRGSEKADSRRCLERPLVEYAPLGVRPIYVTNCHPVKDQPPREAPLAKDTIDSGLGLVKNGKFHANFTLLGRSADLWSPPNCSAICRELCWGLRAERDKIADRNGSDSPSQGSNRNVDIRNRRNGAISAHSGFEPFTAFVI